METISTEQPTATVEPGSRLGKNFNLRAYLAGGAATAALIAAGVVVFGSLAAYVAFNGLPVGGADRGSDSVAVQASAGAPQNAAATLGAAPGAVAATAAATSAIAPAPGTGTAPGGGAGSTTDPAAPTGTTPAGTTSAGTTPTGTTPAGTAPSTTVPDSGTAGSSGPVGNAVHGVQGAAASVGADVPLSNVTDQITAPVDETVQSTLDNLGGVLGN